MTAHDPNRSLSPAYRSRPKERARRSWELHLAGHSWVRIAEIVGYSNGQNAQRAATKYMQSLPSSFTMAQNATVHGARLEELYALAREKLTGDSSSPTMIRAVGDVLKQIMTLEGTTPQRKRRTAPPSKK